MGRPKIHTTAERLELNSIPEPNSGILWLAGCDKDGYALITVDGETRRAHVVAYELAKGPMPSGMIGCHKCDVRCCINERHVFPGTQADNIADMMRKGRHRAARGVRNRSAKLTEADVRVIRADSRPLSKIAADYGMDYGGIGRIKRRETWRHVE